MREFLRKNLEFKVVTTMFFTSEIVIYTMVAPFIGEDSISLNIIWQMVLISVILTLLQYLFYATSIFDKIKTWKRVLIHYILLLVLGYGSSKIFNWFDTSDMDNIIIAASIFTVSFVLFAGAIAVYNKLAGDQFNEKLRIYKSSRGKGE